MAVKHTKGEGEGDVIAAILWWLDLHLPIQSVSLTTNVGILIAVVEI